MTYAKNQLLKFWFLAYVILLGLNGLKKRGSNVSDQAGMLAAFPYAMHLACMPLTHTLLSITHC